VAFSRANIDPYRKVVDIGGINSESVSQSALDEEVEMMDISISANEVGLSKRFLFGNSASVLFLMNCI